MMFTGPPETLLNQAVLGIDMKKSARSLFVRFVSHTVPLITLVTFSAQTALAEDFNFPGLSGTVTVTEDQYGIPAIRGENELDVTFVQGYIQARDRFFQMDQYRKIAAGKAAELLGEAALATDVQFRTFGLGRAAQKSLMALEPDTKGWLQAYANGVNTWLANNPLPPEFTVLEVTKVDPWTPLDSVLVIKLLATQLSLDLEAELDNTIALGTYVAVGEIVGFNGQALFFEDTHRSEPPDGRITAPDFLPSPPGSTESAGTGSRKSKVEFERIGESAVSANVLQLAQNFKTKLDESPLIKQFLQSELYPKGSNAWVISGDFTESGNPLIANDPHLPIGVPNLTHESHIIFDKDGEEWSLSGLTFPGTPGGLLGCNTTSCWGFTVSNLDVSDILQEEFLTNALGLPTHSLHSGNAEPIQQVFNSWFVNVVGDGVPDNMVRASSIGYTNGGITLVIPRHNDAPVLDISGNTGIALAFTGSGATHEATWVRKMGLAGNLDEFKESLQYFDFGSENIFYADVEGNIAFFQTGEKPLREDLANFTIDGLPPWVIRDGTGAAANEWLPVANPQPQQALGFEILPFEEMPHVVNPASGYIANGNSDPVGATLDNVPFNQVRPNGNGLYYLSPYYWSYRMGRMDRELQGMVSSDSPISTDQMKDLQADVRMLDAELVLPVVLQIMSQVPVPPDSPMTQALKVLSTWDYTANTGLAEGWDAGDDPVLTTEPTEEEVRSAAAATVWAMWRSMLVHNTIYATLSAYGLGDVLPNERRAYRAFKHHLFNYETAGGVGASGINFFSLGLAETVAGSLQMALEKLASDDFAPAFANSTNVLDYAWGKLHRIKLLHPFNQDPFNVPNGGGFTDLSPELPGLARQGGFETVDMGHHPATADSLNGPNSFTFDRTAFRRFVAEMAPDDVKAEQVIAGGQSGLFFHPNFADQLPLWLTNGYRPMAVSAEDADGIAVRSYTFGPVTPAPTPEEENTND